MDLIKKENHHFVSAKDLHIQLGIKKAYSSWIKANLERAILEEEKDYTVLKLESTGGRPSFDYILQLQSAMVICSMMFSTNKQAVIIYKELSVILGEDVYIIPRTRREILFEINLVELLKDVVKIETQYSVLNYTVDFYIPELNLVIEYDEKWHNQYLEQDKKREDEIIDALNCDFIRVLEGDEIKAINKILKMDFLKLLTVFHDNGALNTEGVAKFDSMMESYARVFRSREEIVLDELFSKHNKPLT